MRKIVSILLLSSILFSVTHDFMLYKYDTKHSNIKEYILEFQIKNSSDNICDIHFHYHMPFLIYANNYCCSIDYQKELIALDNNLHKLENISYLFKPPIS